MSLPIRAEIEEFDLPHPSGSGNLRISVARHPDAENRNGDVPVLFVLDAEMCLALAAELVRLRGMPGMLPTPMVVGVGYGAESFADFARLRTGDLTPPLSQAGVEAQRALSSHIGEGAGGADAFLSFLTGPLKEEILARYPEASPTDHSLFGHSLGGLFVAYALLARPEGFRNFLCSSPSLWWDGFAILSRLDAFRDAVTALDASPAVLICVGGKEQDAPTKPMMNMSLEEIQGIVAASRMVDAASEFAQALKQAGLQSVNHIVFDGEDHGSVVPVALMRGIGLVSPEPD